MLTVRGFSLAKVCLAMLVSSPGDRIFLPTKKRNLRPSFIHVSYGKPTSRQLQLASSSEDSDMLTVRALTIKSLMRPLSIVYICKLSNWISSRF